MTLRERIEQHANRIALGLGLLLLLAYLYNLAGWMISDDEGEYLYQVWRMTIGEMPYRDFLTPQLPVFLYAGTAVMALFGPSLLAMRVYTVLLAFATGGLIYLLGRRLHNGLTGILAMGLFLAHVDVFNETRIFRNEPIFLLLVALGLVLAFWLGPYEPVRRRRVYLALSGVAFALATMAKLFGALPAGGVGLWLIWQAWQQKRPFAELVKDGLALAVPMLLVLGAIAGGFTFVASDFFDLVLGHHLAQGSDLEAAEVVTSKLDLFYRYFRFYPVIVSLSLVSAAIGVLRRDGRQALLWQAPTVLAFLVVSRQFWKRHFMYLLPALALLVGWLLADGLNGRYRRWGQIFSVVALATILIPAVRQNADRASWVDTETSRIVQLIKDTTAPGDVILVDDIGLAYYARRPTTYSGAALSHGAVTSGQITGKLLIDEIVADDVRMVIADHSLLTGNHIVFLRDYPYFRRFLDRNFEHIGRFRRDHQELDVWLRRSGTAFDLEDELNIEYGDGTRFGDSMRLLGYSLSQETVQPGDTLRFTLFWTSTAPADNYWSVFTHLVDSDNNVVAQHDKIPYDGVYPPNRWRPGQVINDEYAITVPADAPPGQYRLALGMYEWRTGERLALQTATGHPIPNNRAWLQASITVVAE